MKTTVISRRKGNNQTIGSKTHLFKTMNQSERYFLFSFKLFRIQEIRQVYRSKYNIDILLRRNLLSETFYLIKLGI